MCVCVCVNLGFRGETSDWKEKCQFGVLLLPRMAARSLTSDLFCCSDSPCNSVGKKPLTPIKRNTEGLRLKIGQALPDQADDTQDAPGDTTVKVRFRFVGIR